MDDVFRSLFGIHSHRRHGQEWREERTPDHDHNDNDIFDKPERPNVFFFTGPFGRVDDEADMNGSRHNDDMFQHFDEMFRSFDEVFRSMGMAEFSSQMPTNIHPFERNDPVLHDKQTPRDFMLKDPPSQIPHRDHPSGGLTSQNLPTYTPSLFGRLFGAIFHPNIKVKTEDKTDKEVSMSDIDSIVRSNMTPDSSPQLHRRHQVSPSDDADIDQQMEPYDQPQSGVFRRVIVHSYKNVNGTVEERRSISDGSGVEESSISRTMGDKTYSVTTKKQPGKPDEILENYFNMDEDDKKAFDSQWKSPHLPRIGACPSPSFHNDDNMVIDKQTGSIFSNLFGLGFHGFTKRD